MIRRQKVRGDAAEVAAPEAVAQSNPSGHQRAKLHAGAAEAQLHDAVEGDQAQDLQAMIVARSSLR